MIFGKIDPVATVVQQTNPFGGTTVTGSYMSALARPYALGANAVNFQVIYGNCLFDSGSGEVVGFQQVFSVPVHRILSVRELLWISRTLSTKSSICRKMVLRFHLKTSALIPAVR